MRYRPMGSPSRRTSERPWAPGIQRCISSIPELTSSSSSRADAPDFSCHKRTERYIFIKCNSQYIAHSHYMHIKPSSWVSAGHHYRLGSALCTEMFMSYFAHQRNTAANCCADVPEYLYSDDTLGIDS